MSRTERRKEIHQRRNSKCLQRGRSERISNNIEVVGCFFVSFRIDGKTMFSIYFTTVCVGREREGKRER